MDATRGATNPGRNMLEGKGHIIHDHNYQLIKKKRTGSSEFFNILQNIYTSNWICFKFGKNLPILAGTT